MGEAAQELVVFGVNNDTCGSSCDSGQVTTCTTECVSRVSIGNTCSPYPCQSNSLCEDRYGSSCVRIVAGSTWPDGTWRCGLMEPDDPDGGLTIAAPCNMPPFSGTGPLCPTDTWCKDVYDCNGTQIGDSDTVCVNYQTHGRLCDTNAGNSGCALCAPQTTCVNSDDVDLFPYPWANGWCLKSCTTDADCPCEDDGSTQLHTCQSGYCYECAEVGEPCGGKSKCCDDGAICGGYSYGDYLGTCCLDQDEDCTSNSECCVANQDVCFNGVCQDCREEQESCSNSGQCCGDLTCSSGVCRAICDEGKECEVSAGCLGTIACPSGDCVAPSSNEEVCDGVDNDCDGEVDEDTGGDTCTYEFLAGGFCQEGFEAEGTDECIDGALPCVVSPGVDFCTFNSQVVGGDSCGMPAATPCDGDPPCLPNHYCAGSGTATCIPNPGCTYPGAFPSCWMPSDAGTCMDPD